MSPLGAHLYRRGTFGYEEWIRTLPAFLREVIREDMENAAVEDERTSVRIADTDLRD